MSGERGYVSCLLLLFILRTTYCYLLPHNKLKYNSLKRHVTQFLRDRSPGAAQLGGSGSGSLIRLLSRCGKWLGSHPKPRGAGEPTSKLTLTQVHTVLASPHARTAGLPQSAYGRHRTRCTCSLTLRRHPVTSAGPHWSHSQGCNPGGDHWWPSRKWSTPRPFALTTVHSRMDAVRGAETEKPDTAVGTLSSPLWKGAGPGVRVRQSLPGDGRRLPGPGDNRGGHCRCGARAKASPLTNQGSKQPSPSPTLNFQLTAVSWTYSSVTIGTDSPNSKNLGFAVIDWSPSSGPTGRRDPDKQGSHTHRGRQLC